jgi:hypothetical protein
VGCTFLANAGVKEGLQHQIADNYGARGRCAEAGIVTRWVSDDSIVRIDIDDRAIPSECSVLPCHEAAYNARICSS